MRTRIDQKGLIVVVVIVVVIIVTVLGSVVNLLTNLKIWDRQTNKHTGVFIELLRN